MIILKKRRSNTKRTMTPGGETHFLMQFPTVSPREHREGGDEWIESAKMWRSLVESLDENKRDLSGTPSSSKNALAYCLQAIAETDKKFGTMKSHIAEMEDEIDRVPTGERLQVKKR
jgi:hypothetical protein